MPLECACLCSLHKIPLEVKSALISLGILPEGSNLIARRPPLLWLFKKFVELEAYEEITPPAV